MSIEIREIVLRVEINEKSDKTPKGLSEEQLSSLKKELLDELQRLNKRSERNKAKR